METRRYDWDIAEHVLIENDNTLFLDMDESKDRLDQSWLHRPTVENIMEFLLVIDHHDKVVRFGCNNALLDTASPLSQTIGTEYEPVTANLVKPRCLRRLSTCPSSTAVCSQFLLTM